MEAVGIWLECVRDVCNSAGKQNTENGNVQGPVPVGACVLGSGSGVHLALWEVDVVEGGDGCLITWGSDALGHIETP